MRSYHNGLQQAESEAVSMLENMRSARNVYPDEELVFWGKIDDPIACIGVPEGVQLYGPSLPKKSLYDADQKYDNVPF